MEEENLRVEEGAGKSSPERKKPPLDLTCRGCVGFCLLLLVFVMEVIRTADQSLKDRAFELALDSLKHTLDMFKNRTAGPAE